MLLLRGHPSRVQTPKMVIQLYNAIKIVHNALLTLCYAYSNLLSPIAGKAKNDKGSQGKKGKKQDKGTFFIIVHNTIIILHIFSFMVHILSFCYVFANFFFSLQGQSPLMSLLKRLLPRSQTLQILLLKSPTLQMVFNLYNATTYIHDALFLDFVMHF